jgi:hypothetical protein
LTELLSTLEAALQVPLSDLVSSLTLLFAALAAVVGFFTLWFTVIKGPDIRIIPNIKLSLGEAPGENLAFETIALNPVPLLFVNNGSKSGVVFDLKIEFKPSAGFSKFYKQLLEIKSISGEYKQLPLTIPERDTAIVQLILWIVLKPWKDLGRLDELPTIPLEAALQTVWHEGVGRLRDFSKFKDDIGTLDVVVRRTKRHYLRLTLSEDSAASKLDIGSLPNSFSVRAQYHLNNFSQLRETDTEVVRKIRNIAEPFLKDCKENMWWLGKGLRDAGTTPLQTSGPNSISNWERDDDPSIHVLRHEKDTLEKITSYSQLVKQYNERVQAMTPGTLEVGVPSSEFQDIEALRVEMLRKTTDIQPELVKLRDRLQTATAHLIPAGPHLP